MSNQLQTRQQSGFALKPNNLTEAMQFADMLSKSSMVPASYKGKPEDILPAMMFGSELGLNPIQSLQNIAVINGRPSIWGDAMLALVQNHPAFGGITESFDDNTMTATCTVWRKGGEKHTVTFSQSDAQTAGLWGKKGPWQQYPKRMLKLRARGFALRDQFADALSGLVSAEEAQDMPVDSVQHASQPQVIQAEVIEQDYTAQLNDIKTQLSQLSTIEELTNLFTTIPTELVAKAKPLFTQRKIELQGAENAA